MTRRDLNTQSSDRESKALPSTDAYWWLCSCTYASCTHVYWFGTSFIVPMCTHILAYSRAVISKSSVGFSSGTGRTCRPVTGKGSTEPKNHWPRRDLNTQPSDLESNALPMCHKVTMVNPHNTSSSTCVLHYGPNDQWYMIMPNNILAIQQHSYIIILLDHTHYIAGDTCSYHPHIMVAGCTLRQFDACYMKANWEMFIDGCAIVHMLVVHMYIGTSFIVPMCTHILAYSRVVIAKSSVGFSSITGRPVTGKGPTEPIIRGSARRPVKTQQCGGNANASLALELMLEVVNS